MLSFALKRREKKTIEDFIASTVQTSFSMTVASYLLIRMEKRMKALTKAVNELSFQLYKVALLTDF